MTRFKPSGLLDKCNLLLSAALMYLPDGQLDEKFCSKPYRAVVDDALGVRPTVCVRVYTSSEVYDGSRFVIVDVIGASSVERAIKPLQLEVIEALQMKISDELSADGIKSCGQNHSEYGWYENIDNLRVNRTYMQAPESLSGAQVANAVHRGIRTAISSKKEVGEVLLQKPGLQARSLMVRPTKTWVEPQSAPPVFPGLDAVVPFPG